MMIMLRYAGRWILAALICVVGMSPQFAAAQQEPTVITIENAAALQEMAVLRGHAPGGYAVVTTVAFAPDGQRLVSGGTDETVRVWHVPDGEAMTTIMAGMAVRGVDISPDGASVAVAGDTGALDGQGRVIQWNFAAETFTLEVSDDEAIVSSVAYSPDGRYLASGDLAGTVQVWDFETNSNLVLSGHTDAVEGVVFSQDGTRLASVSWDGSLRLWSLAAQDAITAPLKTLSPFGVAFSPDGSRVAVAGTEGVELFDGETGAPLGRFRDGYSNVTAVAFSPDGSLLALGTLIPDNLVQVWDVQKRQLLASLTGHQEGVTSVAFSPDGAWLASSSADDTIRLWGVPGEHADQAVGGAGGLGGVVNPANAAVIRPNNVFELTAVQHFLGHTSSVSAVGVSPDGRVIASAGGMDQTIKLWDVENNVERFTLTGHTGIVNDVAFSPDGQFVVSGSGDKTVKLWDVATGAEVRTFYGADYGINAVAYSPDGAWIAAAEWNRVYVWEAATGVVVAEYESRHDDQMQTTSYDVPDLAFSPDGSRLAGIFVDIQAEENVTIAVMWDMETTLGIYSHGYSWQGTALTFSPDGTQMAVGTQPGVIILLDAASGDEVQTLVGHTGAVKSLSFSPDGKLLASVAFEGVFVWDTKTGVALISLDGSNTVEFSADGTRIFTGGYYALPDGPVESAVLVWALPTD